MGRRRSNGFSIFTGKGEHQHRFPHQTHTQFHNFKILQSSVVSTIRTINLRTCPNVWILDTRIIDWRKISLKIPISRAVWILVHQEHGNISIPARNLDVQPKAKCLANNCAVRYELVRGGIYFAVGAGGRAVGELVADDVDDGDGGWRFDGEGG